MTDHDLTTRTEREGETLDMPEGMKGFAPGQVLGDRYQILEMLGRGGMGEVWHAFDLKLRVEVALKALRPEFFKSERRLELLRQEVRAAREVVSPNVCRIFDLIEVEGRELVSMEYVDGATLLDVLQERGPLELKEAQDIASQFLAGLEAIHKAGLIHRDIKPENIMLTRAGRVVVMDFGLARQETEGGGSVSGTPAYMSPEQGAGQTLDARADVYAAGVVLAEMVSPDGIKSFDSRQSVWEGVRSEPAKVPDTPWAQVIKQAVRKDREGRFNSAHTLTRALEDVTLRVEGADDLHPYPGLASFTEADAEYFFGREAEVEQMWRKLEGPPRMLAIIGPSGAGKSSFIAAGLVAHAPPDWGIIRSTPGNAATSSLAGVVARETAGDPDAVELLPRFGDADVAVQVLGHWARKNTHALVVVDQFEELFTQNGIEEQRRFAELLRRSVLESDTHVLLSMRDDFAAACNAHDSLRSIFHELTVLDPPTGGNLRRAVVQPATKCGYRFEDDELIEEMLAEVEGERGALPLLAFAAARLWEKRDRETGLLTRQAYQEIGGVGGALAQHAEATIDHIGSERIPIVRELFRNLVTAEGTRAVREWGELLSIFSDSHSKSPEEVLRELIDARLLTSYEIHEDEHEPTRRVEIIHESLLANWPRLVRWQTQDQEGAQLRDELRQAARSWDEHGRHDDRLWTGTAYREFELWRERYPGGLTSTEEAYATAMTSFATRRKRRRRLVMAAALVVLAGVASILGGMWAKSERETRRAEANELLALGQQELDSYPSAAVAYAITSLELADSPSARYLAQAALWGGPTALVINDESSWQAEFTPDGRALVQSGDGTGNLRLIKADGTSELLQHQHESRRINIRVGLETGVFSSFGFFDKSVLPLLALWSVADGRMLSEASYDGPARLLGQAVNATQQRMVYLVLEGKIGSIDILGFGGARKRLGTPDLGFKTSRDWIRRTDLERRTGRWLGAVVDEDVLVIDIGEHSLSEPRRLGRHVEPVRKVLFDPLGRFFATIAEDGRIRLWDNAGDSPPILLSAPPGAILDITADGSLLEASVFEEGEVTSWIWLLDTNPPRFLRPFPVGDDGIGWWGLNRVGWQIARSGSDLKIRLWPMAAPADAEPVFLLRGDVDVLWGLSFHPNGNWLASADKAGAALWPLARPYPAVIRRHEKEVMDLLFGPEGRWLVSSSMDDTVRFWPLEGDVLPPGRILLKDPGKQMYDLARTPDGEQLLAGTAWSGARLFSLSGEEFQTVPDIGPVSFWGASISPDGRLCAGVLDVKTPEIRILVWDRTSGEEVAVLYPEGRRVFCLQFTNDGHLLSSSEFGLRKWDLVTGESELLYEGNIFLFDASSDGKQAIVIEGYVLEASAPKRAVFLDFETGETRTLETHGTRVYAVALDQKNKIVATGDTDGVVRVGPITGEEPHLLLGHENGVTALAFDPLGRWVASGGKDKTIRLWPMPDLSKPPLHTLPREDLIAKLKTLTNLRVVRDEESSTGWKLTHDPFPGWETVPTW